MMQEIIKVVATTNCWQNFGEVKEYPMWRSQGSNEYIIGYCKKLPTHVEVGEMITKLQHILEGKVTDNIIEIFSGYELYDKEKLTHNEYFQLNQGGSIDFPAEDITKIKVEE